MNRHLQQFAQQLAIWTAAIIEHGRTPFRRVDTYPDIDTEQGVIQPPLVFWINRQSMMAGGILLLPDNNLEAELNRGSHCASALGLRHFITWEIDQVRIWQVEKNGASEQRSFPLANPDNPETFRYLLTEVLDALKLLAVLGAIPAAELSPCYFNNLFQMTLQQALPPLIEAYRSQRSEIDEHSTEDTDLCANEANRLLLLQVLSLLWFKKIPDAILPEKMEHAIELSLSALPDSLKQPLSLKTTINSPPLPLETAVCFHHLLLRLRQLSWDQPAERAVKSIFRLNGYWFQSKMEPMESATIYFYPEVPPMNNSTAMILSNSPSFLAATALLADLKDLPQCKKILGNVLDLDQDNISKQPISGYLLNHSGISNSERHKYTTRLRTAWPNRHLKIKTGQPFWRWELIHILGICHLEQNLSLTLPIDLLKESENQLAWSLLSENFSFQRVKQLNNGNIQLNILRSKKLNESFPVQLKDEIREITLIKDPNRLRDQLLLTLTLPADIYKLLGHELIWPELDSLPDNDLPGRKLYYQSRLYKWLKNILQNWTVTTIPKGEVTSETIRPQVPYPEPILLKELAKFGQQDSIDGQPLAIDHFLANLLSCPTIKDIELPDTTKDSKSEKSGIHSEKKLKESIAQQLSTHGIPNFPEQYLYFLDQPEMCHYSIAPPLIVKSSLLGQFELEDAQGQIIVGYGEELKQTLLFCSESGKTEIDLPIDRNQLEQLLCHYQKDLDILYKFLKDLCYSQIKNSKTARKVIKNIWGNLNLPTPS